MNNDVVTKYALQNEVPSATILNNVDIILEDRALARLAGHKFIIDTIQSFRNKYPDWKSSLTDLLSVLGTQYRVKKKPNKNKSVKMKTKILKKDDRIIANTEFKNNKYLKISKESNMLETDSDKSTITLQNNQIKSSQIETMLPIENNISMDNDKNIEFELTNINKEIIVKEQSKSDISKKSTYAEKNTLEKQTPKLIITQPDKNLNSLTELQTNNVEDIQNNKLLENKHKDSAFIKIDYKKKRNMEDEIKPIYETVDSFFMTTDDKDYMSVYKPPVVVEKNFEEHLKSEYEKPKKEIFIKGKRIVVGKQNNIGNRRERRQQLVEEPIDTVLHPSWEAKRKQKTLAKFEGKKITFDDQD